MAENKIPKDLADDIARKTNEKATPEQQRAILSVLENDLNIPQERAAKALAELHSKNMQTVDGDGNTVTFHQFNQALQRNPKAREYATEYQKTLYEVAKTTRHVENTQGQQSDTNLTPAQQAYQATTDGVTEKVAIQLKENGAVSAIGSLLGKDVAEPSTNEEYTRIANELIEKRQFTAKGTDGKDVTVTIVEIDGKLGELKESNPKMPAGIVKGLGANSVDELIPTKEKRAAIGKAVADGVEANSGLSFMGIIMGIIGLLTGKGFTEGVAEYQAGNMASAVSHNLQQSGINLSKEEISDISNGVKHKVMEVAGVEIDDKDVKKPKTLAETPFHENSPAHTQPQNKAEQGVDQGQTEQQGQGTQHTEKPKDLGGQETNTNMNKAMAAALAEGLVRRKPPVPKDFAGRSSSQETQVADAGSKELDGKNTGEKNVQEQKAHEQTVEMANTKATVKKIVNQLVPDGTEGKDAIAETATKLANKHKNLVNNPKLFAKAIAKDLLNPDDPTDRTAMLAADSIRRAGQKQLAEKTGGVNISANDKTLIDGINIPMLGINIPGMAQRMEETLTDKNGKLQKELQNSFVMDEATKVQQQAKAAGVNDNQKATNLAMRAPQQTQQQGAAK
ncbi:MAG: hypothetical protein R3D71_02205 [Rickettsiales bacterium]